MRRLIEFPLEDGGEVVLEVDQPEQEGGIAPAARPGKVLERAQQTFDAALSQFKPAAEVILSRLTSLSQRPDEIEIEFGLKVGTQAGVFIASGTLDANFVVKLKWSHGKTSA